MPVLCPICSCVSPNSRLNRANAFACSRQFRSWRCRFSTTVISAACWSETLRTIAGIVGFPASFDARQRRSHPPSQGSSLIRRRARNHHILCCYRHRLSDFVIMSSRTLPSLSRRCHPERSTKFAKRTSCGVEGPHLRRHNNEPRGILPDAWHYIDYYQSHTSMDIDLSALVHLRGCRDLLYVAGLLLRNLCFGLTRNDGRLLIR